MQINLCHYAKTKSVKADFVVASGNNINRLFGGLESTIPSRFVLLRYGATQIANPMLWVQKMNNIRNRVTEIVNAELIYTV